MAGKYFEELAPGTVFRHQPGRTVTETDNLLVTTLTMNPQPLHLDAEFAKTTEWGRPLVNSMFTLALIVGLSVGDTTLGTTVGNLGFEKIATRSRSRRRSSKHGDRSRGPAAGSCCSSTSAETSAARSSAGRAATR